jgi:hypothetical protein
VYDNSIGADQFQWIFQVRDMKSTAIDYFWFNVTLFDNRYEIFPGTQQFDSGKDDATGKFIYAPTGEELFGDFAGKIQVGTKYHIEINIKQYLQTAFSVAQQNGALTGAQWENMAVNGFNLGWEVSNVARVGATMENLSLTIIEQEGK